MAKKDDEEVVILESPDDEFGMEDEEITTLDIEGDNLDPIEDELSQPKYQEEAIEEEKNNRTKKLILLSSIVLLALIIIVLIVLIALKLNQKPKNQPKTTQIIETIQKKQKVSQFTPSKIDAMLKRANILYEQGNKIEALSIYKDIATYNEAISQYNIGVAKMKEGDYKNALVAFKNAILNKEKRTVSAINGAICALELNNKKLYEYYIDLAYTYLPEESNSPLYSYYIGLINYYKGNYLEALNAFSHPTSEHYKDRQKYLASKVSAFLNAPHKALSSIQSQKQYEDLLALGLLYANIGEYELAQKTLEKSINNFKNTQKASLALALVNLKLGNFQSSANILQNQLDKNATLTASTYPIHVKLNSTLFNVHLAQKEYKNNMFFSKSKQYALLFYFAPYKIFNTKENIDLIRKGGLDVFVDEIDSGLEYLKTSSTIAKINEGVSDAIKQALNHHYLQANESLKKLIKIYPKHSILHYNLALTYAQLGNYTLSFKHFLSSYRLDSKNYLAGIFAVMSSELIGKDNTKLIEEVKVDIDNDKKLKKVNFFMTLTHLIKGNQLSMNRWLEVDKSNLPLHLMFDIITAHLVKNDKIYNEKINTLRKILPYDIITNILYLHVRYKDKNIKEYAEKIQMEFNHQPLNMSSFYYGSSLVKEQYVKMLQISGLVHVKKNELKKRLKTENEDVVGVMQALAYIDLYTNDFEEAYSIYNSLIDEHKQQDTNTIFYAAIASIGANHPQNAIALLELSKLIDSNNLESRYGLALAYQQIKNFDGAIIQYKKMGDNGFKSKYFSFDIVK